MKRASGKLHRFEYANTDQEKTLPRCAKRLKEASWYPLCERIQGCYVKVTYNSVLNFDGLNSVYHFYHPLMWRGIVGFSWIFPFEK